MFSVVITTKDREKYLLRALESALNNSILPNDIVVVNDGGKKLNLEQLNFGSVELKIINNDKPKGANYCRNIGIDATEKEFVFLLDDDDAFTINSFKERLSIIESNSNIGICFTGVKVVRSSNLNEVVRVSNPISVDDYFSSLIKVGNVIGSTSKALIRKYYFNKAGRFDEELSCLQDYDLWIRMAKICAVKHDNQSNVLYTVHDNGKQISSKYSKYLNVGITLSEKYKNDIKLLDARKSFLSGVYLRASISAAPVSFYHKTLYSFKSFCLKPSIKNIVLLFLPFFILRKIYAFV
ncbi:glycosyltransferase family 2 protein [Vibrio atlanticus]|nr:glycosyltransferase family 2 protein [Vibrio atlanticus]